MEIKIDGKTCLGCGDQNLCSCGKCHNAACERFHPHPGDEWKLARTRAPRTKPPGWLRAYRLYSLLIFVSAYTVMTQIWLQSSEKGLSGGIYEVTVRTDLIGENWPELFILLTALPGVVWIFYRVLMNILKAKL